MCMRLCNARMHWNSVCHGALRLITNLWSLTLHGTLYEIIVFVSTNHSCYPSPNVAFFLGYMDILFCVQPTCVVVFIAIDLSCCLSWQRCSRKRDFVSQRVFISWLNKSWMKKKQGGGESSICIIRFVWIKIIKITKQINMSIILNVCSFDSNVRVQVLKCHKKQVIIHADAPPFFSTNAESVGFMKENISYFQCRTRKFNIIFLNSTMVQC